MTLAPVLIRPDAERRATPDALEALRRRGQDAVERGAYEEALLIYESGVELAEEIGDEGMLDRLLCNRAAVRFELYPDDSSLLDGELCRLREVLGRTRSAENGWLASYQLGRLYEQRHLFKKALFYAQMACNRSDWTENPRWQASSHNLRGNVLLAESAVDDALQAYRQAIALLPSSSVVRRARIVANMGYCWMLRDRLEHGLRLVYQGLRTLRRQHLDRFCISPHLDLSYGLLESGRADRARRHARRSLYLATAYGDSSARKNALFMLGETELRLGEQEAARATFEELQRRFFDDNPSIVHQLMTVDMVPLFNLRA